MFLIDYSSDLLTNQQNIYNRGNGKKFLKRLPCTV